MTTATIPIPENEPQRLAALESLAIMDTLPERAYDDITLLASIIAETPISLITLLDADRQWFKSRVGLEISETPRDVAFCAYAITEPDDVLVVRDATADERFMDNPLVTGEPDIRFYAGAPLVTSEGEALGTLCVIDRRPREISERQLEALRALARQVMAQLELRMAIESMEESAALQARYEQRLESYQRELEAMNAELHAQSRRDPLTGLANRRAFDGRLVEEVERAARYLTPLSLIVFDIDEFKRFNDTFGHPEGDRALSSVAEILARTCRESDLAARYGGEEFAIVLPNTAAQPAIVLAERVRRAIREQPGFGRRVTVSAGVASLARGMDARDLIRAADATLYEAKRRGRDRVELAPVDTTVEA